MEERRATIEYDFGRMFQNLSEQQSAMQRALELIAGTALDSKEHYEIWRALHGLGDHQVDFAQWATSVANAGLKGVYL